MKKPLLATTALIWPFAFFFATSGMAAAPIVVDGARGGGYVISDGVSSTAANPRVMNSGSSVTLIGAATATSVGAIVSVGSDATSTIFTNFYTEGGAGSGGGGGLGGVFFVDNGRTLNLTNVEFVSNVAKGGAGGAYGTVSVSSINTTLTNLSVDVSKTQITGGTPVVEANNGQYYITGVTLGAAGEGGMLGAGSLVSAAGNAGGATVAGVSGANITFSGQGMLVDQSKIATYSSVGSFQSYLQPGTTTINFSSGTGSNANTIYANSVPDSKALAVGMPVVGPGFAPNTSITQIQYATDGTISGITLSAPYVGIPTLINSQNVYSPGSSLQVIQIASFDATRFKPIDTNTVLPVGIPVSGITAGMAATITLANGATANTTITNVAADGSLTFAPITLDGQSTSVVAAGMTGFTANLVGATAGSAVISPPGGIAGLAVGMAVSGPGIAAGTTIASLANGQVVLSQPVTADTVNAIKAGNMYLTFGNVLSVNYGANTVQLGSTKGLKVGEIITGTAGNGATIPTNAVVTGINSATGVVSYKIVNGASDLTTGGSMNGLVSNGSGSGGASGLDGGMWQAIFHNGEGQGGLAGYNGQSFNADTSGHTGGTGGAGGSGSRGLPYNVDLMLSFASQVIDINNDFVAAAAEGTPDPLPKPVVAAAILAQDVQKIINVVQTGLDLVEWQIELGLGLVAHGGAGNSGGAGGSGSTFFGGGLGGAGGNGGDSATARADGGAGGSGGSGGAGGFGAGGGSGGAGGNAGYGGAGQAGSAGSGGAAGFGGGVGSSASRAGGGGSGYGGALFVAAGGNLNISGNSLFRNNAVLAGSSNNGGPAGNAAGSDLFIMKGANVVLSPGIGNTIRFEGVIADDSAASINTASWASGEGADLHVTGGGLVQLMGANTYTGTTYVEGATLQADDGMGISTDSHISFSGVGTLGQHSLFSSLNAGVWLPVSQTEFYRLVGTAPTDVSWTGSGGFAATAAGLLVNFGATYGGSGQQLTWGSGNFVPVGSTLVFGSDAPDATGTVTFMNSIDLGGNIGQIAVYNNAGAMGPTAVMSGNISNGTLQINDTNYSGTLVLTGQNTLSGVTVNNGTLSTGLLDANNVATQTGQLMDPNAGGSLAITGAATVRLFQTEKLTTVSVANQGTLRAYAPVTARTIVNSGDVGFGAGASTGNITNDVSGMMAITGGAIAVGDIQNAGGLSLTAPASGPNSTVDTGMVTNATTGTIATSGSLVTTGAIDNQGWAAFQAGAQVVRGDVNNSGTLALQAPTIATGSLTNQSRGALWVMGNAVAAGPVTNNATGQFYLVGDLTAGPANGQSGYAVSNSGTMFVVGQISGASETGSATRTIYTTGFYDPNGVYQLGGLNGMTANTLVVNQTGNSVNSGTFTGAGSLVFTGGGTMNMTGASDFTGGLTVQNSSTIDTTGGGTFTGYLPVVVSDSGSTLTLGTNTLVGSIQNNGQVNINASVGVSSLLTGSVSNTGTLNVNYVPSGNGSDNTSFVLAGALTNGSDAVVSLAAGSVTLVNAALTNSGTLNNNGGNLTVFSDVTNQAGGTVALGSGSTTNFSTLTNAGVLSVAANTQNTFGALTNTGSISSAAPITVLGAFVQNGGIVGTTASLNTGSLSGTGGTISLNNGAVFTVNQDVAGTYSGVITGNGSVYKTGLATLTLAGAADSFAPAALTVAQGRVSVNGASILDQALSVTVQLGAVLGLQVGNQTIHGLAGSGSIDLNGNSLFIADGGSFNGTVTGNGQITVQSGGFTVGGTMTSTAGQFAVQSGSQVSVPSSATLNVPSFAVAGTADVQGVVNTTNATVDNGGTLHLGDGHGGNPGQLASTDLTVNGDGRLTGVGSVSGQTTVGGQSAGAVAPGNSPGILQFQNLTFDNSGAAQMEIYGAAGAGLPIAQGGYDQIQVAGKIKLLPGSVLNIISNGSYAVPLGQAIPIFRYAPGAVSGMWGSATNLGLPNAVLFNIATGEAIGLGNYTPASFAAAVSTSPNQKAVMHQLLVNTAGGVPQYYGGNLMRYVTAALAGNGQSVADAFARWSPASYANVSDHMMSSMLNNLGELGGYNKLSDNRTTPVVSYSRSSDATRTGAGYPGGRFDDNLAMIGLDQQILRTVEVQVTLGHVDGTSSGSFATQRLTGDQVGIGVSAPIAMGGDLRAMARYQYGTYSSSGSRYTMTGVAGSKFSGQVNLFGAGLQHVHTFDAWRFDTALEWMGGLIDRDAFREVGPTTSPLDLMAVRAQHDTFSMMKVGTKVDYTISPTASVFGSLAFEQELNNPGHALTAQVSVEDQPFTVHSLGLAPSRGIAGAGVRWLLFNTVSLTVQGRAATDNSYVVNGSARVPF